MGEVSGDEAWRRSVTTLPCGHEVLDAGQVHYCSYIGLSLIEQLSKAFPGTGREREAQSPDEQQFIRVHQMIELAYEQILFDLPRALETIVRDELVEARLILERMTAWMGMIPSIMRVFSTMRPESFHQFRKALAPASGAESLNSRRLEIRAGVLEHEPYVHEREHDYTYRAFLDRGPTPEKDDPKTRWWTAEMTALARQPTLRSVFRDALQRFGETLETLHVQEKKTVPLRLVADGLYSLDRAYSDFRQRHTGTAAQQIGKKPGTGHTSGVPYLTSTNNLHLFPELWAFRQAREAAHRETGRGGAWDD